jgi:hypothetical protein
MKLSYAADQWFRSAKAKAWIMSTDVLKPGALVVLFCRVSNRERRSHLKRQEQRLRKYCQEHGLVVIAVFYEVRSATPAYKWDRTVLERAALVAHEHNATLVALSVDRFIRGPLRKEKTPMPPSALDFHRFQMLIVIEDAEGNVICVPLATLLHPDLGLSALRSVYTKMGFAAQSKPGDKKRQKEVNLARALRLHKSGMNYRRVGRELDVPWTTVRDWISLS